RAGRGRVDRGADEATWAADAGGAGAAVVSRRARGADRRADAAARERAGAVGQTVAAAALVGERAGIAVAHAAAARGQTALPAAGVGAAELADAAVHRLLAHVTDGQAVAHHHRRRHVGAAADAGRPELAAARAALGVRRAPLLLGSAAGRPGAARRAVRRRV